MVLPLADLPLPTAPTSTMVVASLAAAPSAASLPSTRTPDSAPAGGSASVGTELAAAAGAVRTAASGSFSTRLSLVCSSSVRVSPGCPALASGSAACCCASGVPAANGGDTAGEGSRTSELLLALDLFDSTSQSSTSAASVKQQGWRMSKLKRTGAKGGHRAIDAADRNQVQQQHSIKLDPSCGMEAAPQPMGRRF